MNLSLDPDIYDINKDPFIQDEDNLPVEDLIRRILIERSSFVDLSEQSLKGEIEGQSEPEEEGTGQEEEENIVVDEERNEGSLETFEKHRAEFARNVNIALNETSLSMDMVSLLLSIVTPNVGKSTISPHLFKSVPLGSLNSDRLRIEDNSELTLPQRFQNEAEIGQGWKSEAIENITSHFMNASNRVKEEIANEKKYWDTINKVLENDDVIFRTKNPKNGSRTLGVKYGFGDSGSSYYDKGLAILRPDETNGEISLYPLYSSSLKFNQKIYKYVKVKILTKIDEDFILTGQTVFHRDFGGDRHKVINEIEKARYFLFEEDLMYHLIRESQLLISYSVSIISNKIIVELANDIIEIEFIPYDENNEEELNNYYQNISEDSTKNDDKAQMILTYMKLMLCCFYDYNLKLAQKAPTAVTKWKQSHSHPLILRPLLGLLRHEKGMQKIIKMLDQMKQEFKDKVNFDYSLERYTNLKEKSSSPFQKAVEIPISTFKISVSSKSATDELLEGKLDITTGELFVNTILKLSLSKFLSLKDRETNINGVNVLQVELNDIEDLEESLKWPVLNFING